MALWRRVAGQAIGDSRRLFRKRSGRSRMGGGERILYASEDASAAIELRAENSNLMILAVGYRVRSPRGAQFRPWATAHLREYLVKGLLMDDGRLKGHGGLDSFDELLARIRNWRQFVYMSRATCI